MSWEQLKAILDENRKEAAEERRLGPVSCPNDGSLLDYNPKTGKLNCPMGDFQTTGRPQEV